MPLEIPNSLVASNIVLNDLRTVDRLAGMIHDRILNGIQEQKNPATGVVMTPSVSADDYKAALGDTNLALLESLFTALRGSSPEPTK